MASDKAALLMLRRVAVLTGACAAVMLAARTVGADVMIGQEWTPVANENGYTYYDGFTSYSGNGLAQVVLGGNPCLQLDITNPYWGQSTGQMWANPNLTTANFNSNPRLEFDLDLSQWHWG